MNYCYCYPCWERKTENFQCLCALLERVRNASDFQRCHPHLMQSFSCWERRSEKYQSFHFFINGHSYIRTPLIYVAVDVAFAVAALSIVSNQLFCFCRSIFYCCRGCRLIVDIIAIVIAVAVVVLSMATVVDYCSRCCWLLVSHCG